MFLATVVLAVSTWKYMNATKIMADRMSQQSEIMQKEFEFRTAPFLDEVVQETENLIIHGKAHILIVNKGFYPVLCLNVDSRIFANDRENESYEEHIDILKWLQKDEVLPLEITFKFDELSSFSATNVPRNNATAILTFHYQGINGNQIQKEKRLYF